MLWLRLLLFAVVHAAPGGASAPPAWPQTPEDAPSLLRWAAAHSESPADYAEAAARYLVYARSGAMGEAREALRAMEGAAPGDPDAERFALRLRAALPEDPVRLLADCDASLDRWRDSPAVPPAQYADLQTLRRFVAAEAEHTARVRRARRAAFWLPLLAALLMGLGSGAAFRRLRPR